MINLKSTDNMTYFITFLIVCAKTSIFPAKADVMGTDTGKAAGLIFAQGDARNCLIVARKSHLPLKRFSSLPGIGWDNLRNEAAGQVFDFRYNNCKVTEDGQYLIPDDVLTIPIKSSRVETFAEMYESSNNVTSITSRSINVDAGLNYGKLGVSGSFSYEHIRVKRKQIQYNAVASRVQLRYLRYMAKSLPGSPLHPLFKRRLYSIAADLNQNMTQSAFYKAQLLVRDYGTHVLTGVVAGACLVKTDLLKRSYVDSHNKDKTVITASASASFAHVFQMNVAYKTNTSEEENSSYQKSMTSSYVTTHGGPIYRPYDMTVSQWVHGVGTEMVPMDRSGDPLYYLITTDAFPGLPVPLVEQLGQAVEEAVTQYYEMNTVRGCTKKGSPNFSYAANLDDGSCVETNVNMAFGGIYQTCKVSGDYVASDPCTKMSRLNALTKGYSCPSKFISVLLHSGVKLGKHEEVKKCKSCGFLWTLTCCNSTYTQAKAKYSLYWCASIKAMDKTSGFLFGGTWSSLTTNLVTRAKKCPYKFYPISILKEHFICVSDDYKLAEPYATPFGGFTSCLVGNPWAVLRKGHGNTNLEDFMQEPEYWPRRCPEGFSKHLSANDDDCEIHYCIKTGALSGSYINPIRRPPFTSRPLTIKQSNVYTMVNSRDNSIQDQGMVVSKKVYDQARQGKRFPSEESSADISVEASGAVGHSSSSFSMAIIVVGLLWNQFCT